MNSFIAFITRVLFLMIYHKKELTKQIPELKPGRGECYTASGVASDSVSDVPVVEWERLPRFRRYSLT